MPKYRKKPVVIEATRYEGGIDSYTDVCVFVGQELDIEYIYEEQIITIPTLEGELRANKGDYIIKGIKGEFYPCKPDIFEATYEKAD